MALVATLAVILVSPVGGAVARPFDVGPNPYAAGRHRGVDLAAPPGAPVRAACGGRVVVAGRVGSSGPLVTVRCGPWRVTHMPVAALAVRPGGLVAPGARLGRVAASSDHAGLHLGVRREGDRSGYVDPLRFLAGPSPTPPPAAAPLRGRRRGPPVPPAGRLFAPARRFVPASRHALVARGDVAAAPPRSNRRPLAPWQAWGGLALVLAGAGLRWRAWRGTGRPFVRIKVRLPLR